MGDYIFNEDKMLDSKKTILVTGSSGFIGRNIVQRFSEKYNIISPSHQELDLLHQDEVNNFFKNHNIDYVIHCAGVGGNRKYDDHNTIYENTRMFFNIYQNNEFFIKMIHMGTGAEYNKKFELNNVKEINLGKNIPTDEYGFSKYIITKYIEKSEKVYCLKPFGVFGPYEDYEYRFISNAIVKNLLHLPIRIMQNVFFDWIYIDDLLNIIDFFIEKNPCHKVYNITTERTIDLVSIAKLINRFSDYQSKIEIENEGLNLEYSGDNSRLLKEIGSYGFIDMENAIQKLIEYYKIEFDKINVETIKNDDYAIHCNINKVEQIDS